MTLTVMFAATWSWLPFLQLCWDESKVIAMGWGPLQIYITNYSPIAVNNSWQEAIYYLLDKNEEKTCQVINLINNHFDDPPTLERGITAIKK